MLGSRSKNISSGVKWYRCYFVATYFHCAMKASIVFVGFFCVKIGTIFVPQIPSIHWRLTSERVLTMEFCHGGFITDTKYIHSNNISIDDVREHISSFFYVILHTVMLILLCWMSSLCLHILCPLPVTFYIPKNCAKLFLPELLSVYVGHTEHRFWQFLKRLFYKLIILLNEPHFTLLYASYVDRKFTANNNSALCNILEHLRLTR